jgi:hypothetical protein
VTVVAASWDSGAVPVLAPIDDPGSVEFAVADAILAADDTAVVVRFEVGTTAAGAGAPNPNKFEIAWKNDWTNENGLKNEAMA